MSLIVTQGYGNDNTPGSLVVTQGYGHAGSADTTPVAIPFIKRLPRWELLRRGIRFSNAPKNSPDYIAREDDAGHLKHVNSIQPIAFQPSDRAGFSGVVRFQRRTAVPSAVRNESRGLDRFGNPIFPFTGE